MKTGMLWFDDDPKATLETKITKAANYYRQKYGAVPDTCIVNPKLMAKPEIHMDRIVVRPNRSVLPNHLWIGIEEKAGEI